jgi:hypothetical protein
MKHKYNITEAYKEFSFKFNKIREVQGITNEHLKKPIATGTITLVNKI